MERQVANALTAINDIYSSSGFPFLHGAWYSISPLLKSHYTIPKQLCLLQLQYKRHHWICLAIPQRQKKKGGIKLHNFFEGLHSVFLISLRNFLPVWITLLCLQWASKEQPMQLESSVIKGSISNNYFCKHIFLMRLSHLRTTILHKTTETRLIRKDKLHTKLGGAPYEAEPWNGVPVETSMFIPHTVCEM